MYQLLLTVMAIALLAIAATAGISYVNYDTSRAQLTAQMVSSGFIAWEQAFTAYRLVNRAVPTTLEDLEAYLAGPRGGAALPLPKAPAGFSWSYGSDASGTFVCLSGSSSSSVDYNGLTKIGAGPSAASPLPPEAVALGPACGEAGVSAVGQPMAVTYRLSY